MNRTILKLTWAFPLALATQFNAQAGFIKHNETSFLNHLEPGFFLNTFDGYDYGEPNVKSLLFSQNGFSYTITSVPTTSDSPGMLFGVDENNDENDEDGAISTEDSRDLLTVTFTGGSPTAVGGDFFLSNEPGRRMSGDVIITLSDGSSESFKLSGFNGFLSKDLPISSLAIDAPPSTGWPTLDDLYVGKSVVPTPDGGTTVLMLGVSLIGLNWLRRRAG